MLHYIERKGGKFYRKDGTQANALDIAKDHGVNIARVRIYNDPGPGRGDGTWYCPPNYVIERDALRIAGEARERGMDLHALLLNPQAGRMQQELLDKHYLRKHGPGAYYGQKQG